jgi:hypothetical protein
MCVTCVGKSCSRLSNFLLFLPSDITAVLPVFVTLYCYRYSVLSILLLTISSLPVIGTSTTSMVPVFLLFYYFRGEKIENS